LNNYILRSRIKYYNNIVKCDEMKLSPLQWLAVVAVIVVVSVAASPAADTPPAAAASATDTAEDDDDDDSGGGSVFPFKALQLYNTVAGYLEYIFDIVITPITGK